MDYLKYFHEIYIKRDKIIKITLFFFIYGTLVSFTEPHKYKTTTTFVPQSSTSSQNSNLSGLAGLAGISIDSYNDSKLSPNIYPMILKDISFKRELLNIKINENSTLKDYLNNQRSYYLNSILINPLILIIDLKNLIINIINQKENLDINIKNPDFLSENEKNNFDKLDKIISISLNQTEGYITLSVIIDDSNISFKLLKNLNDILQKKIIEYEIQNAKNSYDFINKNFQIKKNEFEIAQNKLARFKDNNQIISSSLFSNELFILQNNFNLINSIYQDLAKQAEQAKIKMNDSKPIFTTIIYPYIPNERSNVSKIILIINYTLAGLIISVLFVVIFNKVSQIRKEFSKF